jgi:hypothetical protein
MLLGLGREEVRRTRNVLERHVIANDEHAAWAHQRECAAVKHRYMPFVSHLMNSLHRHDGVERRLEHGGPVRLCEVTQHEANSRTLPDAIAAHIQERRREIEQRVALDGARREDHLRKQAWSGPEFEDPQRPRQLVAQDLGDRTSQLPPPRALDVSFRGPCDRVARIS